MRARSFHTGSHILVEMQTEKQNWNKGFLRKIVCGAAIASMPLTSAGELRQLQKGYPDFFDVSPQCFSALRRSNAELKEIKGISINVDYYYYNQKRRITRLSDDYEGFLLDGDMAIHLLDLKKSVEDANKICQKDSITVIFTSR